MTSLSFSPINDADIAATIALWQQCGLTRPWNDPANDIAFARTNAGSALLIGREQADGPVITTIMVGHDGHRGWVYYLAVDPAKQGSGYGKQTMQAAEQWLLDQGIWKAQLLIRRGNEKIARFYEGMDYQESSCMVMERWIDPTKRGDFQA